MSLDDFVATRDWPIRPEREARFWFQSAPMPDGTRVRSHLDEQDTQYLAAAEIASLDASAFEGRDVLDIGAADGMYAMMAVRGGARGVTALDCDYVDWPANLRELDDAWGLGLRVETGDFRVHDFGDRRFGAILLMGVLYHLEDPFAAIRRCRDLLVPGGALLVETQLSTLDVDLPVMEMASDVFASVAPQGEAYLEGVGVSNYVFPNRLGMMQLARTAGLSCRWLEPSIYSARLRSRGIFLMERPTDPAAPRWHPRDTAGPDLGARMRD